MDVLFVEFYFFAISSRIQIYSNKTGKALTFSCKCLFWCVFVLIILCLAH